MNPLHPFTLTVISALLLGLGLRLWLAARQVRHVRRHRAAVPAAFVGRVELAEHQRAADYTIAKTRFAMVSLLYGAVLLGIWTVGGALQALDTALAPLAWPAVWQGTAFLLSFFVLGSVIELPFDLYETFRLETRFGFNQTTPAVFVADLIKGAVLALALGTPLIAAALWFMELSAGYWWLWLWILWTVFSVLLLWAYPRFIAPLFNTFTPLVDTALAERISALLRRTGFASRGVFVMDGSRRSSHGNAYFTGLGRNKRIVFFDTLLKSLAPVEIEAVLAHELGHFKHRHVVKRIALGFALSFAALYVLAWFVDKTWFYAALGVAQPSHAAALALFVLVGPWFSFFLRPLLALASRRDEFEADAFAATHSDGKALTQALVKLYRENAATLTPDPLHSAFYDSHPPAPIRIARLESAAP